MSFNRNISEVATSHALRLVLVSVLNIRNQMKTPASVDLSGLNVRYLMMLWLLCFPSKDPKKLFLSSNHK